MAFYRFLADAVLVLHFAYVAFVVLGMAAILAGIALGWQWVRNFWFRGVHFLMIAAVAVESLLGILCPLTHGKTVCGNSPAKAASRDRSSAAGWTDCCSWTSRPRC